MDSMSVTHRPPATPQRTSPEPPGGLTQAVYLRAMDSLGAAFARTMDQVTYDAYLLVVKGYRDRQLMAASASIMASDDRFPTPKRLALALQEQETPYQTYRRETDVLVRSWLRVGAAKDQWTPELYRFHCRRLGMVPNEGLARQYVGAMTPEEWKETQARHQAEMD